MANLETKIIQFSQYSDSESDEEVQERRPRGGNPPKTGACVHCKSLKVRCQRNPGSNTCQRCVAANIRCVARTRKKRKPAPTHEALQERSLEQDKKIQELLQQMDQRKAEHRINLWLRNSDSNTDGIDSDSSGVSYPPHALTRVGVHSQAAISNEVVTYFRGPYYSQQLNLPDIVKYCGLRPADIIKLFEIFFERVNPYFSLLDPELHTPHRLIWGAPFLFTVILAVASRYYTARPDLYQLATKFAREAAGKELVEGSKSVDIVQGYLLLAVYPVPKKSWAEDRSWLLMGVAIRMAFELQLNQPPPLGLDERESMNRTRTWLTCYCADGSHAIQFGKMPMLHLQDYVARTSKEWYRSPVRTPFDIHLCAYVEIIIVMGEWKRALDERNSDPICLAAKYDPKLGAIVNDWVQRYCNERLPTDPEINEYRGNTTQLITAYLQLVVLSRGFQHAIKRGMNRDTYTFFRSVEAAHYVINIVTTQLFPTGHLKFALEANFLYVSFAAAFLINLLRPKFLPLLDQAQEQKIVDVVTRLIEILRSKDVALDGRHTPALYSRFLSSLLGKHNRRPLSVPRISHSPSEDSARIYPQYPKDRQQTPPGVYSWPDVKGTVTDVAKPVTPENDMYSGRVFQHTGEPDLDFGIPYFVSAAQAYTDMGPVPTNSTIHQPVMDAYPQNWGQFGMPPYDPTAFPNTWQRF